jgi:hypothetical protein
MKVLITELIWPILVAREVTKVLRGQPSLCVVG